MSERAIDLRKPLRFASMYTLLQNIVGSTNARRWIVNELIKPQAGAKVLDIGCGPGRIYEFFPPQVEYVGYDPNPNYIAFAQNQFKGKAEFHQGTAGELEILDSRREYFDFVIAIGVLHHLDDNEAGKLVRAASMLLKKGGTFLTFDCVLTPEQSKFARFVVSLDRGGHVRDQEGYTALVADVFPQREPRLFTKLLKIPYSHFVLRCIKN